jgi:D-tyrosyl-tRNA(Tyr) deacylase
MECNMIDFKDSCGRTSWGWEKSVKALIQRVSEASVSVDDKVLSEINQGYVVLLGVRPGDTEDDARQLAHKTVNLRIFADEDGKMNRSVEDINGSILVISQFTLYADTRKGNRPSFIRAAPPNLAEALYEAYVGALRNALGGQRVGTGRFGAMMLVKIWNEGPVTIELTTERTGVLE